MNAWTLLYEELEMNQNITEGNPQEFWNEDGISFTGNPYPPYITGQDMIVLDKQQDSIDLGSISEFGGNTQDSINYNSPPYRYQRKDYSNYRWKYDEAEILKQVEDYISSTYNSHYTSGNDEKTQTLDLIDSIGDAEGFTRSNAIKYLSRFGKKDGKSKLDILKAIHYCILLYHFSGLVNKTGNYETF